MGFWGTMRSWESESTWLIALHPTCGTKEAIEDQPSLHIFTTSVFDESGPKYNTLVAHQEKNLKEVTLVGGIHYILRSNSKTCPGLRCGDLLSGFKGQYAPWPPA